jgi:hypothetical protein
MVSMYYGGRYLAANPAVAGRWAGLGGGLGIGRQTMQIADGTRKDYDLFEAGEVALSGPAYGQLMRYRTIAGLLAYNQINMGVNEIRSRRGFTGSFDIFTGLLTVPAQGVPAGTTRVFSTTSRPVDFGRAGTGARNAQTGTLTPTGAGGTFVTRANITDPDALLRHIQSNVPPFETPKYVTEIEVPTRGLKIDPTELTTNLDNGWIPPSASGARIVKVWRIVWLPDPQGRGFDVPHLIEVPQGGR